MGTQQEIDDLWAAYDDDSSGDLEKFDKLFEELDTDGSNSVDKEEFERWWLQRNKSERQAALGEEPEELENFDNEMSAKSKKKRKSKAGEVTFENPVNDKFDEDKHGELFDNEDEYKAAKGDYEEMRKKYAS